MPINPGFAPLFEMMKGLADVDMTALPAANMRMILDNPIPLAQPITMARVEDLTIPVEGESILARLYVPESAPENPPVMAFFHGGGFVHGTLETHDGTCRMLARESGLAVISIAYRLAPEHRYPTAVQDAFAAAKWIVANCAELGVDGAKLVVAGDSAGGNIAAALCQMAKTHGGPAIAHQLLIYPVVNMDFGSASYLEHGGEGNFLTADAMRRYWSDYLGDTAFANAPLANLLQSADVSGLPSATVIVAQCDPLRDEGVAYANKLADAGVDTKLVEAPGMIHGFFSLFEMVPEIIETISLAGKRAQAAVS